jgi:hypothetical protein
MVLDPRRDGGRVRRLRLAALGEREGTGLSGEARERSGIDRRAALSGPARTGHVAGLV